MSSNSHEIQAGFRAIINRPDTVQVVEKFNKENFESVVSVETYNFEGELLEKTEQPFKSFTANILRTLWGRWVGTTLTTGKDFGGNNKDMSLAVESNIKCATYSNGISQLGLALFGNSDTNTPETYTGTIVTGLTHKTTDVSLVAIEADRMGFTISKRFENTSGSSKSITKIGILTQTNATGEIGSDDNTLITIDDNAFTFADNTYKIISVKIYTSKDFFTENFIQLLNHAGGDEYKRIGQSWASGANGTINVIVVHPSTGEIYIGGSFTSVGGVANTSHIAKWGGTTWSSLGSGAGIPFFGSASISDMAFDSSNNLYVVGNFRTINGVSATGIAKWNGTTWSALGSGLDYAAICLTIDSINNIYVGGSFITAGGITANYIAKWNGTAWSALGTSGTSHTVYGLAKDTSNNIYVTGRFTSAGGVAGTIGVAKWNGTAWSALATGFNFTPDSSNYGNCICVISSNEIYFGLRRSGISTNEAIAKWNGTSFSYIAGTSSANVSIGEILFINDTNIYVGGNFASINGVVSPNFIKYNGVIWDPINNSGSDLTVSSIVANTSGGIYVGGAFTVFWNIPSERIIKLSTNVFRNTSGAYTNNPLMPVKLSGSPNDYANIAAGSGVDTWGIMVGTSNTAKGASDYTLGAKISHGTSAGTLEYSPTTNNQPEVTDDVTEMSFTRTFTNSSGGSITIREIGVALRGNITPVLIARDLTDFTLNSGESVTIEVFFRTRT